ncbi:MAG: helix-turn-helix domain-containing protein [Acidimicrobiia bacterium]|nr:helix-turn-helix domain-containing protein [Acidimicrobiia bacterium]
MAVTVGPPDRKSYEQVCPMATALDLVGDRWTILILRELLGGPARFQDLRNGLPGIAPNLLTDRLRRLETDGILRRLPSGGTALYAVTAAGEAIRTAIEELGMWGARMGRVGPATHDRSIRAIAMALQSILVRAGGALPQQRYVIELQVDGEHAEVILDAARPVVVVRPSIAPDAQVAVSSAALSAFLLGEPLGEASLEFVSGNEEAVRHLVSALGGSA